MANEEKIAKAKEFLESAGGALVLSDMISKLEGFREKIEPQLDPDDYFALLTTLLGSIEWEQSDEAPIEGEGFLKPVTSAGIRRLGLGDSAEIALRLVGSKAL